MATGRVNNSSTATNGNKQQTPEQGDGEEPPLPDPPPVYFVEDGTVVPAPPQGEQDHDEAEIHAITADVVADMIAPLNNNYEDEAAFKQEEEASSLTLVGGENKCWESIPLVVGGETEMTTTTTAPTAVPQVAPLQEATWSTNHVHSLVESPISTSEPVPPVKVPPVELAPAQGRLSLARPPSNKKVNNEQWEAMFARLIAFKEKHGHCLVPKRCAEDPKLGIWVETQRVQFNRLERVHDEATGVTTVAPNKRLDQTRLSKLESIGFAWSAKNTKNRKAVISKAPIAVAQFADILRTDSGTSSDGGVRPEEQGRAKIPAPPPAAAAAAAAPKLAQASQCQNRKRSNSDSSLPLCEGAAITKLPAAKKTRAAAASASPLNLMTSPLLSAKPKPPAKKEAARKPRAPAAKKPPAKRTTTAKRAVGTASACAKGRVKPAAGAKGPSKSAASGTSQFYGPVAPGAMSFAAGRWNDNLWEQMYQRLVEYKARFGNCLVPRKYEADPKLATWVETQRVLWNRDYRDAAAAVAGAPGASNSQPLLAEASETVSSGDAAAGAPTEPFFSYGSGTESAKGPEPMEIEKQQLQPAQFPALIEQANAGDAAELKAALGEAGLGLPPAAAGSVATDSVAAFGLAQLTGAGGTGAPLSMEPVTYMGLAREQLQPPVAGAMGMDGVASLPGCVVVPATKRLSKERKEKLDALGFVWSLRKKRIEDHWDDMFGQLVEYKRQHGDCLVPSRYEANVKLGKWVETQRYEYTKLQRVKTGASCSDSVAMGGGAVVEAVAPAASAPSLAQGGGKTGRATNPRLTYERIRRLESIGFEWKVKHKMKRYYDKQWDQMFERLLAFKKQTGHCMVPKRFPQDMKLGTWVHTQRIQYRKMKLRSNPEAATGAVGEPAALPVDPSLLGPTAGQGEETKAPEYDASCRLTEGRRRRLEEAGFVWSAREGEKGVELSRITRNSYDDQWDAMFDRLREYKQKHGHCLVPKRFKEDPKLGTWVDTQRVAYKKMQKKLASEGVVYQGPAQKPPPEELALEQAPPAVSEKPVVGRLTDDRVRRLESLGFVWSLRDDWQKHYEELKRFRQENGHCNVPARYAKNRRLGLWVSAQRQQYKLLMSAASASPPRGDVTDAPEAAAATPSAGGAPGKPKKASPLTPERIKLLNDLGFTWIIRSRDSLGEPWNQRLQELKAFQAKFGHVNVPSRYEPNPELGIWVGTQRTQYRLYMKAKESGAPTLGISAMNEDRIRQLERLGFVWALRSGETGQQAQLQPQPQQPKQDEHQYNSFEFDPDFAMYPAAGNAFHHPSGQAVDVGHVDEDLMLEAAAVIGLDESCPAVHVVVRNGEGGDEFASFGH